jgi:hypothetical protein
MQAHDDDKHDFQNILKDWYFFPGDGNTPARESAFLPIVSRDRLCATPQVQM